MDFVLVKRVVDRMVRIVDDTELSKRLRGETKRIVLNCSACLDRACTLEDAGTMDEENGGRSLDSSSMLQEKC